MRFDRSLAAKFESKGFPNATEVVTGTVPEILIASANWLKSQTLNSRIIITLGKDRASLSTSAESEIDELSLKLAAIMGSD